MKFDREKIKFLVQGKVKLLLFILICVLVVLFLTFIFFKYSYAEVPAPSLTEHIDVLEIIIGTLFFIATGLISWILIKVDKNQTLLFKRMNDMQREFYLLQGEHNARVGVDGTCYLEKRRKHEEEDK